MAMEESTQSIHDGGGGRSFLSLSSLKARRHLQVFF